jgi:hypothetical protein
MNTGCRADGEENTEENTEPYGLTDSNRGDPRDDVICFQLT